jgi:hypothetical protein
MIQPHEFEPLVAKNSHLAASTHAKVLAIFVLIDQQVTPAGSQHRRWPYANNVGGSGLKGIAMAGQHFNSLAPTGVAGKLGPEVHTGHGSDALATKAQAVMHTDFVRLGLSGSHLGGKLLGPVLMADKLHA